jgi:type I restriction enzyme R subunit
MRGKLEINDLFQPPLSILNAAGLGVELFGEKGLQEILQEMNESVFLRKIA